MLCKLGLGPVRAIKIGCWRVRKSFANVASRCLCLVLAAALFLTLFNAERTLFRSDVPHVSAPNSNLLLTQQTKFAAIKPQKPQGDDTHPKALHPVVASAEFVPQPVTAARVRFAQTWAVRPRDAGWHARAPPSPLMPVTF